LTEVISEPPVFNPSHQSTINFDSIPQELKELKRWVVWKLELGHDKRLTKIPYNPRTGNKASSTNPKTWEDFTFCRKILDMTNSYAGVGFVLSDQDDIICIDLDSKEGKDKIEEYSSIARRFNSFSEISHSGKGLHIWCRGTKPGDKCRCGDLEIYSSGRFIALTGNLVDGTPGELHRCQQQINEFYDTISKDDNPVSKPYPDESASGCELSDDEIIRLASKKSAGFSSLFGGNHSQYPSQSEADGALCCILAWYTRDIFQIDRIFRRSGLYRTKWEREDYRTRTIGTALQKVKGRYDPNYKKSGGKEWLDKVIPEVTSDPVKKTTIVVNGVDLPTLSDNSLDALMINNDPPRLFIRSGGLARIITGESGDPVIDQVKESALRGRMARCADFVRRRPGKDGIYYDAPVSPPLDAVRDIMSLGEWSFPPIIGITESPVIHPDGSITATLGYDYETRLFYAPDSSLTLPKIPDKPSPEDIKQSVELIQESVCDFPFQNNFCTSNLYGAMLTSVVRNLITGPVPMLIIDKPQAGTGASLLAEVLSIISTGGPAEMFPAPRKPEEWPKSILSILLKGKPVAVIDNLEGILNSSDLAALLTCRIYSNRLLGKSEMTNILHRTVWIGSGNNVQLGGDLPRRCYWCRLDAKEARPWMRTGFKHPDLTRWLYDNRGRILAAILTLARGWIQAGRPKGDSPVIGSFEEWSKIIGGILYFSGITGFLGNLDEMYDESDTDTPQWEAFLTTWKEIFNNRAVTVAELTDRIEAERKSSRNEGDNRLIDSLPGSLVGEIDKRAAFVRTLGRNLARRNGMRFPCGLHLIKDGSSHRAIKWSVVSIYDNHLKNNSPNSPLQHKNISTDILTHINSPNSPKSDMLTPQEGELGESGELNYNAYVWRSKNEIHIDNDAKPTHQTHSTHPSENTSTTSEVSTHPNSSLKELLSYHGIPDVSPEKYVRIPDSKRKGQFCICHCGHQADYWIPGILYKQICSRHLEEFKHLWELEHQEDL